MSNALPAAGYTSASGRSVAEQKTNLEAIVAFIKQMMGGAALGAYTLDGSHKLANGSNPMAAEFTVAANSGTTDQVNNIDASQLTFVSGNIVTVFAASGHTITVKNAAGGTNQITTIDGNDFVLSNATMWIRLKLEGTTWVEIERFYGTNTAGLLSFLGITSSAPLRNAIMNSTMFVAPEGTSGTVSSGSTAYTLEGWQVTATGANCAWSQIASPFASPKTAKALQLTGASGLTAVTVKQRIESNIAAFYVGQIVTFQMRFLNNSGSSVTPTLTVKHPTTTADDFSSLTTDVNGVNLQAVGNGAEGVLAYAFTVPAGGIRGLEITVSFGGALNNTNTIKLGEAGLQVSPSATSGATVSSPVSLDLPRVDEDRRFCERYFETSYDNGTAPGTATHTGIVNTGAQYSSGQSAVSSGQIRFRTVKRAAPTVTAYDGAGTAGQESVRDSGGWSDANGAVSIGQVSTADVVLDPTAIGAGQAGNNQWCHFKATARL